MAKRGPTIDKQLDDIWALVIKTGGRCEHCGKKTYLNAHHLFSRSCRVLRWEVDNGMCLCASCHSLSSIFSAHKSPLEFTFWLIEYKGKKFIDKLIEMKKKPYKLNAKDKLLLLEKLNKEYEYKTSKAFIISTRNN